MGRLYMQGICNTTDKKFQRPSTSWEGQEFRGALYPTLEKSTIC